MNLLSKSKKFLSSSLYKNLSGLAINLAYSNLEYTGLHLLSALGLTEVIETLSRNYDFVICLKNIPVPY